MSVLWRARGAREPQGEAKAETKPRSPACLNCGCERAEKFCPECGQENVDPVVPVQAVLKDAAEDLLKFDSRLFVTLRALLLRPGFLTAEFLGGRRAPYIAPMKLFLIVSALYIFVFSVTGTDREMKQAFVAGGRNGLSGESSATAAARPASPPPAARDAAAAPADPGGEAATRRQRLAARQERMEAQLERMGVWYTDNISLISLALLPGYAFTLWLLYRGRRLFVECFVCTLYGQSALYLLLLPLLPLHSGSTTMLWGVVGVAPVYNYLSLRRAFDRPAGVARWRTALRTLLWTAGQILVPMLFGILLAVGYLLLPELLPAAAAPPAPARPR